MARRAVARLTEEQARAYWIGEYASILAAAGREGWLVSLLDAHARPCTRPEAQALVAWLLKQPGVPRFAYGYGSRCGHAYFQMLRGYRVSLPPSKDGKGQLRVGIVLHEVAHLVDHVRVHKFSHGASFRTALRRFVDSDWRSVVKDVSQAEIYARHRGPYSLLLTREGPKKTSATDRHPGPFSAEDAHERARKLVEDPNDNVTAVHVFSDNEGQFIGAFYKRGGTYLPWEELRAAELDSLDQQPAAIERHEEPDAERTVDADRMDDEDPVGNPDAALLSGGQEPLQEVEGDPERPVQPRADLQPPPDRSHRVRTVPQPGAGGKRGGRIELNPDKPIEAWPKGEGPKVVREAITASGPVTTKELVELTTPALTALGVGFPASMISRLKQAGLLREAAE